jgi:hypothetical protein
MGAPFSFVPLVDPRSSIMSSPSSTHRRACRRDTRGSVSTMSETGSRPTTAAAPARENRAPSSFPLTTWKTSSANRPARSRIETARV